MTLPSLVDVPTFAAWIGSTITAEGDVARARAVVTAASTVVRSYAGLTWVTDGQLDEDIPDTVTTVTLEVARRIWSIPPGVTQRGAGPFQESFDPDSARGLSLTDDEKALIDTELGDTHPGLTVISTTRGPVETPSGPSWR